MILSFAPLEICIFIAYPMDGLMNEQPKSIVYKCPDRSISAEFRALVFRVWVVN